jgi:hypothetical protein
MPAMAQPTAFTKESAGQSKPEWTEDIVTKDGNLLRLKNNREYRVENGYVVESVDLDGVGRVTNLFDFENTLVIHRYGNSVRSFAVTPFREMQAKRVNRVKLYGCHIAENGREQHMAHFYKTNCQ